MLYYTIYKTTNLVNGKIYIGKHQTKNINDDYVGSGKLIWNSVKKYGIENFLKEILFVFDNEEEMNDKEAELVTEEFVKEETNYNLCPGGKGGWGYVNSNNLSDRTGMIHSAEAKSKMGQWGNTHTKGTKTSEETKQKLRLIMPEKLRGREFSQSHRENLSKALKGKPLAHNGTKGMKFPNRKKREPLEIAEVCCPHCNKSGGSNIMRRWHFDNCKERCIEVVTK